MDESMGMLGSTSSNQPMMGKSKSSAMARRMSMNSSQPMMRKSKSSARARRVSNINTYEAGVEKGVNISQEVQAALPGIGSSSNGLFGGSRKRKNKRKQKKTRKHKSRKH